MSYTVSLNIQAETFQRFQQLYLRLQEQDQESIAKALGEVLADISCEVVEQVFGHASREYNQADSESEKVLGQIKEAVKKYMPWSVSLFSNARLVPMVHYLSEQISEKNGKYIIHYDVDNVIIKETLGCLEQIRAGNYAYIPLAFKALQHIIDQGVDSLIREPKKMLKFNFVVDKTLTGVINFTTQLGYRRLEKLSTQFDAQTTDQYFSYLLAFMHQKKRSKIKPYQ